MAVDFEFEEKILPLSGDPDEFKKAVDDLARNGWTSIPGTRPFAVFNLMRPKGGAQMASALAEGHMVIDDDKVLIRSGIDGKLRKADGTIVSEN